MTHTVKGVLIAIVGVFAVVALIWGIGVAVSGPKGQGDAYSEKNSAKNWTKAQEDFNQRYQSILAADRKINTAYADKEADPDDEEKATIYRGLVNGCEDAIASYNTKARSYLSEDFRDADLPASLPDPTNPEATDCAPTKEK